MIRLGAVRGALMAAAGVVALSAAIDAQAAIFVARHVLGRVETMSQQSTQKDGPGYDSAAVMLEAPAKQVYATALNALQRAQAQGISITREDDTALMVQFTKGQQIADMKISQLGENLSHMLSGSQPNAAALVSDSVLRVCREMKVECSPARQ